MANGWALVQLQRSGIGPRGIYSSDEPSSTISLWSLPHVRLTERVVSRVILELPVAKSKHQTKDKQQ